MSCRLILQQERDQSPKLSHSSTAWELTVSGSISLPDGGSFHASFTAIPSLLLDLIDLIPSLRDLALPRLDRQDKDCLLQCR
ncbi:hypothetical protein VNO78_24190 [Psophocarpus tetragonolobus]|uniref:Uncharacterized protein n=1 Tax=Psophocarpus tetragonolobus TaxID=3891 RepID=A0AAN9XE87_PSOTE